MTWTSIAVESGSQLFAVKNKLLIDIIHRKLIHSFSVSVSRRVPRDIQILASSCFASSDIISLIVFESPSQLRRIEKKAFASSSIKSMVIPRNVEFIDGSAFLESEICSISVENENSTFVIKNCMLIDIVYHKLVRNFSNSSHIQIPGHLEILGSSCCANYKSLSSTQMN
jgi:putative transposon-encoded protein